MLRSYRFLSIIALLITLIAAAIGGWLALNFQVTSGNTQAVNKEHYQTVPSQPPLPTTTSLYEPEQMGATTFVTFTVVPMASLPTATITPLVPPAAVTAEPTLITEAWVTPTTPLSDMTPLVPTAVVTAAPTLITESRVTPTIPLSDMAAQLDPFFDQSEGTFGVIMIDLTTGMKRYTRNVSLIFPAASLIKVPIAVTVYQQASQGIINLDAELTMDASVIVGGTGSLQYDPPGSTYPVRELVARMLYDSDNTAANMLIDHLGGFAPVNETMQQIGATQTVLQRRMMDFEALAAGYDNLTSPADMALLFQLLYTGAFPDAAGSQEIINALLQTTDRQKIPAQLPPDVAVAHKIGTLPQVEHDAGIVQLPGQPYILVLMSQELVSNAAGINTIATASRLVYDEIVNSP